VWNWLHQHRGHTKRAPIFPSAKLSIRTSPQHTSWLILKEPPSAKAYLEELYRASPVGCHRRHELRREFYNLNQSGSPSLRRRCRVHILRSPGSRGFEPGLHKDLVACSRPEMPLPTPSVPDR
jgi:hypothetical protein